MSDHSELKRLAEEATAGPWVSGGNWVSTTKGNSIADCPRGDEKFIAAANPSAVLALIADLEVSNNVGRALGETLGSVVESRDALVRVVDQLKAENEALRSKLTTVHFVCDRLPDQDGCRFIELENSQGESLGAEVGKWEIRPDGLAQLVVTLGDGDFVALERGYAELWNKARELQFECDKFAKDAERYRWLRQDDVEQYQIGAKCSEEKMDAAIDAAMAKEVES